MARDTLKDSLTFAATIALVPMAAVLAAVTRAPIRWWASLTASIAAMLACWVLISNAMNMLHRFQFPILVVAIIFATKLWTMPAQVPERTASTSVVLPLIGVALLACLLFMPFRYVYWNEQSIDGSAGPHRAVLSVLRDNSQIPGRTVATSEAGLICWSSNWNCTDLWGLNDKRIAHDGFLKAKQLDRLKPDVVFFGAPTSPLSDSVENPTEIPGWTKMTTPLIRWLERDDSDYELATILGPTLRSGYPVYVRKGEPWSDDLIKQFQALMPLDQAHGERPDGDYSLPTRR